MRKLTAPLSFTGRLEYGELIFQNPKYFRGMLNHIDNVEVRVTIAPLKGAKSNRQLAYLYGVPYFLIAEDTGNSIDVVDAYYKDKFLKNKVLWRGEEIFVAKGKTELSHDELGEFIEQVVQDGRESGLDIPDPDKKWDLAITSHME